MKLFGVTYERELHYVQLMHALRSVALSFVIVYVPIFLLKQGFSLIETVIFFIFFHLVGLFFGLTICPKIIERWGLVSAIKISYPFQILFFVLLNALPFYAIPWWVVATIGGIASFVYWIPLNILFLRHSDEKKIGSDVSLLFALPKIFSIAGPLLSAIFIPFFGFWAMFVLSGIGLIISYLPLSHIKKSEITVIFKISESWNNLKKRKLLFILEGFDNIIEESEWFWGIFVFLIIGSLSAPGIVGGLEALGGAIFTIFIGKFANQNAKKLIPVASAGMIIIWFIRIFIDSTFPAYYITLGASFVMTFFLVSYFSFIYKNVKDNNEEEFLILREIPTVIGRMIVFGMIILTVSSPRLFFILPIIATIILLMIFFFKRKQFESFS